VRNDIIDTMHRALPNHGLAEERGVGQFVCHGKGSDEKVVGRVIGKGPTGDEMSERVYLAVDGVDGSASPHEVRQPDRIEELRRGTIVEAAPAVFGPKASDQNSAIMAEDNGDLYQPSRHRDRIRASLERQGQGTRRLSSAPASAAWKPCSGPAMWSASTQITGSSRKT
jgi:hypothetical protein